MRGKRSKQYRKLMQQYALTFNFREPYQVLVDAQMIQDAYRFKMDLAPALSRTLHGEVKPMITQCSIRHLFALPTQPPKEAATTPPSTDLITKAEKTALLDISRSIELRRCNHHTLAEPLSTLNCYKDVMDSKEQGVNKHRYVLAVQDEDVRSWARGVKGVPMIYVKRSVMIMEPMTRASAGVREIDEKGKLRSGVKKVAGGGDVLGKRKREGAENASTKEHVDGEEETAQKKKRVRGLKGPNPLSVKKKLKTTKNDVDREPRPNAMDMRSGKAQPNDDDPKKKRRRKHKSNGPAETGDSEQMGTFTPA